MGFWDGYLPNPSIDVLGPTLTAVIHALVVELESVSVAELRDATGASDAALRRALERLGRSGTVLAFDGHPIRYLWNRDSFASRGLTLLATSQNVLGNYISGYARALSDDRVTTALTPPRDGALAAVVAIVRHGPDGEATKIAGQIQTELSALLGGVVTQSFWSWETFESQVRAADADVRYLSANNRVLSGRDIGHLVSRALRR
ncbi:hypothetical protein GE115_12485 [Agromyces sp. CFH 90414]|uniref:Uncharacterized protein n=1 Tax=Agromyces agglutinans TaxID=2662258 RepID=A0A6I2F7U1_9MICO|nr:hypothetical protein [Agromyces agglutinans]MRG60679.1 hypothetical protein [Agromyces agglutinans]